MTFLYFIYGLSFYSLGISTLFYPRKDSEFPIAKSLLFIAIFGITHGMNEWVTMFSLMQGSPEIMPLKIAGLILLPISFLFLILFGTATRAKDAGRFSVIIHIPICLFVLWIILIAASRQHFLTGNILARYLLGVPGTFLAAYSLFRQASNFKTMKPYVNNNFRIAGFMFVLYGIFTGLLVPRAGFFPASFVNSTLLFQKTGIPVEIFRTVCAIVLSYNFISILSLFAGETKEKQRLLSLKDELTGCLNRRGFFALAEQQIMMAKRQRQDMLLLIGDMDKLKWINDTFGHQEGDRAICEMADILKKSFRESDIIARIGGDEFAILQAENIGASSNVAVARLQHNLSVHNAECQHDRILSMSIGSVRCAPDSCHSLNELMKQADRSMYEHKKINNQKQDNNRLNE